MGNLRTICRACRKHTSPDVFREIAAQTSDMQISLAIEVIRDAKFIRNQFGCIFEHMEDDELRELQQLDGSEQRGPESSLYYLELQSRQRQIHEELVAVCQIYATAHNHMQDRLQQLRHPAVCENPRVEHIIAYPRGERLSVSAASEKFYALVDELT